MPPTAPRPAPLTAIAFWHFVVAAGFALGLLLMMILCSIVWLEDPGREALIASFFFMLAALAVACVGVTFATVGWGLLRGKSWARPAALVLAAVQLPLFPIGTAAGGLTLVYLLRNEPRESAAPMQPVAA